MYADRYAQGPRFSPASLGVAIAVNAAFVAALIFSSPVIEAIAKDPPITIFTVPEPTPPPPEPVPQPLDKQPNTPIETIHAPIPPLPVPTSDNMIVTTTEPTIPVPIPGPAVAPTPMPPPPLPFVEPSVDPRYADDFQPVYPADERRAGRDGRVKLRVLVGMDGRVKQVEQLDATSEAFARAAIDRARARWRFRPATRGGIPVEAWRVMTLSFVMKD